MGFESEDKQLEFCMIEKGDLIHVMGWEDDL